MKSRKKVISGIFNEKSNNGHNMKNYKDGVHEASERLFCSISVNTDGI